MTEVNAVTIPSIHACDFWVCVAVDKFTQMKLVTKGFRSFIQKCPQATVVLSEMHQ